MTWTQLRQLIRDVFGVDSLRQPRGVSGDDLDMLRRAANRWWPEMEVWTG